MKKALLFLMLLIMGAGAKAQVGIGTDMPNPSAQLDVTVQAGNKGVLIARVALTGTTDATTITNGNVESLLVYNTTTVTDVTPGYYYWYNNNWKRIVTPDDISTINPNTINVGLNTDGVDLILNDSDGNFVSLPLSSLSIETITNLVDNGDGTITYANEEGTIQTVDIASIAQNNESVTTMMDNGDGTYTYTSEDGTIATVNIPSNVLTELQDNTSAIYNEIQTLITAGSDALVDNGDGTFTHTAADGTVVIFDANTLTVTDNGDGTYTLTNSDGTTATIDVAGDVLTELQDNTSAIYNEIQTLITAGSDALVDNGDGTFTHTAADGTIVTFDANTSTVTDNGDGTYTIANADGTTATIDVAGDVLTELQDNTSAIYNEIRTIITAGSDALVDNGDGTFTHTAADGTIVTFDANTSTVSDNGDGTYTIANADGTTATIDVAGDVLTELQDNASDIYNEIQTLITANETLTTSTFDSTTGIFTYTDEDGTANDLDLGVMVPGFETTTTLADNADGTYTYTSEDGTDTTFEVTQSGAGDPVTNSITGAAGDIYVDGTTGDVYTYNSTTNAWETANPETITTLVDNGNGTYTYTNEDGATTTTFDVTRSGAGDPITNATTGTAGDVYVDESTGDVYAYNGTTWVKQRIEPWQIQTTTVQAEQNSDAIYQIGSVAIGKNAVIAGAVLDVAGAIRGGAPNTASAGVNSLAVGEEVIASGVNSTALGFQSEATGTGSFAGGGYLQDNPFGTDTPHKGGVASGTSSFAFSAEAEATAIYAIAVGFQSKATETGAVAIGYNAEARGGSAIAFGHQTRANSFNETVMGTRNAIEVASSTSFIGTDPILQVGIGNPTKRNALTILKNGDVGIGISGQDDTAKPTERLDIGSGNVKVRDLPTSTGSATDNVVVVDATGVLKSVAPTDLETNTTLAFDGVTNELTYTNENGDNPVLDLTALITEPWNVQGTTDPATSNTENIYQTGSVAILKNGALAGTALDVEGAIRGGTGNVGTVGANSAAFGDNNTVSGVNSGAIGLDNTVLQDYAVAFGSLNEISNEENSWGAAAFGQSNTITGMSAQAFGNTNQVNGDVSSVFGQENASSGYASAAFGWNNIATSPFEVVLGRYNAITTSSIPSNNMEPGGGVTLAGPTDPVLQLGSGDSDAVRRNSLTVLNNGSVGIGIVGIDAAAKPTERLDIGSGNARIRDINTNIGAATDKVVVADADGVLKTVDVSDLTVEVTASNGLNIYAISGDVQLGGLLLDNTEIATDGFNTTFTGTGKIGLGTNDPKSLFHINSNGDASGIAASFVDGIALTANVNSAGISGPGFYFEGANATAGQRLFKLNYSSNDDGNSFLNFQAVTDDAAVSSRQIMQIYHSGNIGIGLNSNTNPASERLDIGTGNVRVREINTNIGAVSDRFVVADATGVLKTVAAAGGTAIEPWNVQGTTDQAQLNTDDIYQMGNIGIGTTDMLGTTNTDVKLAVNGAILTTNSIYADYVFEDYFEGRSELNNDYAFKSLKEVEKFIQKNRHLPGITKIDALAKNEKGDYIINTTQLSVQLLEKVEELYLHTIEQQRILEGKNKEIKTLKEAQDNLEQRMEHLEKLLLKKGNNK